MVQKTQDSGTSGQARAARGRPRSFDSDKVLAAVRETFWRYGYDGTSMDQLVAATGLHKPSLYGAFGDKRTIYLKALEQYMEQMRVAFGAAFSKDTLMESLEAFAASAIEIYTGKGGGGCFMMSTAVPVAGGDAEIGRLVRDGMEALDRALVRRFRKAIETQEIRADADAETLAAIIVANHYDLSARARAGFPREELRRLADRAIDTVRRIAVPA